MCSFPEYIHSKDANLQDGLPIAIKYDLQKVVRVDKITYLCFFTDYLITNKPCIITDLETKTWKSRHEWITSEGLPDFDLLTKHFGKSVVPVAECDKQEYNSQHKIDMLFKDYLSYWKNLLTKEDETYQKLYLKDWHFQREYPSYEAYKTPDFFHSDWLNEFEFENDDYKFLYMGPKGTWTPLHMDVFGSYSWSANICGYKKWWLFPPGNEKALKDQRGKLMYLIEDKDASKFKDLYLEVIQGPGEVLFVPSGWHHQVQNIEHTISINHNFLNACNILHAWKCLSAAAADVEKELSDIAGCEEWEEQWQLILKVHHGFNYSGFYQLLKCVYERRKQFLESLDISDYSGQWEEIFDIQSIKNVCNTMLNSKLPSPLYNPIDALLMDITKCIDKL